MKAIFTLLFFFCGGVVSPCTEEGAISCEKTYVALKQLHFTESSIFVEIDSIWVQPTALHVDSNGFYFESIVNEVVPGPWQCQVRGCHHWNKEYVEYCAVCGARRGGTKPPRR
jgi:hypothetical protein